MLSRRLTTGNVWEYRTAPGTSGHLALARAETDLTGTTRSSAGLDVRRKRLLFRCWHRGTREMDLILGRFADARIADLSDAEVDELEKLLDLPDADLYAALTGARPVAAEFGGGVFEKIRTFDVAKE